MDARAYQAMRDMQSRHWWWRGMRSLYEAVLLRFRPKTHSRLIVDVGCGFGGNLPLLNQFGAVVGVDIEYSALEAVEERPALGLVQARTDALPFRSGTFDIVALLAIIEHTEDDTGALRETRRISRDGAIQLILTSAFPQLWSHHDRANNHHRRYYASQLHSALSSAGWKVLHTSYVNAVIFPAVLLVRLVQRSTYASSEARYDMGPGGRIVNRLLEGILRIEANLVGKKGLTFPFGVNLMNVSQRHD